MINSSKSRLVKVLSIIGLMVTLAFSPLESWADRTPKKTQTASRQATGTKKTTAKKAVKRKTVSKKKVSNAPKKASASEKKRDELKHQQASLQEQLGEMKKQLSRTEANHHEAVDALAASEAAISQANRRLRNLGQERSRVEKRLKELREQELAISGQLTDAEKQIRVIAQAQYLNSKRESWQTLLAGTNPHEIARDTAALRYFAQAQQRAAKRLTSQQVNIQSVSEETLSKKKELASIESREKQDRAQLLKDQTSRKNVLASLKKQITTQRASIDKMERDQARLGELVSQIDKLLAKQKAEAEAEAKRKAELARRQQSARSAKVPDYKPPMKGHFAKQKGKLMMPVLGKIVGRFGLARANISGKSTTWKGLQIRAEQGSDVLACATGKVVFADWFRGFGNLIIVDHGDGFISIYGHNETLYKTKGDPVNRGETIASVGNTGGGEHPALYFELRHNGRPFNPLPWIGKQ